MTETPNDAATDVPQIIAELQRKLAERAAECDELLLQQAASAEILGVINSSHGDLAPVFDAMLEKAMRLCEAAFGSLYTFDGEHFQTAAQRGLPAGWADYRAKNPPSGRLEGPFIRLLETKRPVHIPDIKAEEVYRNGTAAAHALVNLGGGRTVLYVPLLKDHAVLGTIVTYRQEVRPFTDKQIALLENFAAQAVIAMENARLFNETKEALEQQAASSDILRVISQSPTDVQPVFEAIVLTAVRLTGCDLAFFLRCDGATYSPMARATPEGLQTDARPSQPIDPDANFPSRAIVEKKTLHLPDWSLVDPPAYERWVRETFGIVSSLYLPLLCAGVCIGLLVLAGKRTNIFGDREIALAESFRDQAVIAIENVRLFDEVQAKTRDLTESLQQQTATAEVLKVISRSAFDLGSVLNTLTHSAAELCKAEIGALYLCEGDVLVALGVADADPAQADFLRRTPLQNDSSTYVGRTILEGAIRNIADVANETEVGLLKRFGEVLGFRSILFVPLMREGRGIGVFALARKRAGQFSQRDVNLVRTFADQAVIAIENVRLFNEVQDALERQTATADILKVIASSPSDVQPVFEAVVNSAARLFEPCSATITTLKEGKLHWNAFAQIVPSFDHEAARAVYPIPFDPDHSPSTRAILERRIIAIPDTHAPDTPEYTRRISAAGGFRSITFVPLIHENRGIGTIILTHPQTGFRFSDKQLALLQTFADQAVIAIENARLFDEVQAKTRDLEGSLQQQTATADVLKIISRSAFDLQAVFNTLTASAVDLLGAISGTICVRDGDVFRYRATGGAGWTEALWRFLIEHPVTPGRATAAGRAILSGKIEQIPDILDDPDYAIPMQALTDAYFPRAMLSVPLLGKDRIEGALVLSRAEPGAFTKREVDILQTFADQAVIAIENVRLFDEVQARTRELAASLDELRTAQDRLVQTEKLASLGQLTAGIAHEIKNPLNFVNNFSALSAELIEEMKDVLSEIHLERNKREELNEITQILKSNLEKVVQHGKRADSIVKNMLQHSREGSGEHSSADINAIVEESLNLAYHGARAEKAGFSIAFQRDLDPSVGMADVYPQEITRVLLNLISNGFYATTKRKAEAGDSFEPKLSATTKNLGDKVEIRIRDNGTGISDEIKGKIFNPFFTTKPSGEGTGLGLSMSHDIIVKQHGGSIDVASEPGVFTEFKIVLPRASQM